MLKRIIAGIILLIMVSGIINIPGLAMANEVDEIESEIESYQEKQQKKSNETENANQQLEDIQDQINQAYNEFQELDEEAAKTKSDIDETEEAKSKTEDRIDELETEIDELEVRIAERDELLKDRIKSMYQSNGAVNYIDVLLGASNFGDFIERVAALHNIAQQDRNLLDEHIEDQKALEQAKEEVEISIVQLEEQMDELAILLEMIEDQLQEKEDIIDEMEKQKIDTEDFIVSSEEEMSILANQEEAAKKELEQVKEKENQSSAQMNESGSAVLQWPTGGRTVTSPYGPRTHPVHGTQEFHYGIDISRDGGTDIVAAEEGTVIEARYMQGYGNTIMLSHKIGDQTVTTLYAHLESINVQAGQRVERGENIAVMGTTGVSTGVHLHFEVHEGGWNGQKSNSVDPLDYLN